jgi:hypothetical protein
LATAGAAGIGLEIVKAFAASGAAVLVCDIYEAALKELEQNVPGVVPKFVMSQTEVMLKTWLLLALKPWVVWMHIAAPIVSSGKTVNSIFNLETGGSNSSGEPTAVSS